MSSAAFNSLPESLSLPFFLLANVCVCVIELRLPIGASGTAVCWIYQWHRIWSANINRTCIFANSAQCLQGNFGMTCNRSVPTAHCPPQKNFIRFWCYVARNVDSQRFCCKNSTTAFNSIFFFLFLPQLRLKHSVFTGKIWQNTPSPGISIRFAFLFTSFCFVFKHRATPSSRPVSLRSFYFVCPTQFHCCAVFAQPH